MLTGLCDPLNSITTKWRAVASNVAYEAAALSVLDSCDAIRGTYLTLALLGRAHYWHCRWYYYYYYYYYIMGRCDVVAALCYKQEGRGFETR
jgi:hypothetical protein